VRRTLVGLFILIASLGILRWSRGPLVDQIPWSTAIYDENGELLRLTLSKDEKYRLYTPLDKFPKPFVDAVLFKEDRYFRYHWGVNPWAIFRAAYQTYFESGRRIGGSTISMQLARLKYGIYSKSMTGKAHQMLRALELEIFHSKNDLLEAYLNLLPYGSNVEGAGTASLIYLGKDPMRLNLPEIFTLSVIPQSPKLRSLGARGEIQSTHQLIKARDQLFEVWALERQVSAEDRLSFQVPFQMKGTKDLPFLAPHFTSDLLATAEKATLIQTTLRKKTQKLLERKLAQYIQRQHQVGIKNAAVMLVDWTNMEVKASVGSADFFDSEIAGQVNGTKAMRSPGSTLKPFSYALAFDQGLMHGQSLLKDAPATYAGFDPENFDRDFQGPITAENALIHSRNLPAVQVTSMLSKPGFYEFLQQVGIQQMKPSEHYGLSTILGGLEVTMEDLVRLYAMLPNQGELRGLKKIKSEEPTASQRFLSPEASYLTLEILKKMPRPGTAGGSPWSEKGIDIYWKTGTSQAFRDAWTLGIAGRYVIAIWLGNFNGDSNPALIGRDMAAPLFFEIVDALKSTEKMSSPLAFSPSLNIKKVAVCSVSGQLPGPHCHHKKDTWFIPGKSPISVCDLHREIMVDKISGLRLCNQWSDNSKKMVFEFWPSDLLKLFNQAGMPRAMPPAWDPHCELKDVATNGKPPSITSPQSDLVYSLRADQDRSTKIALRAIADADVRETFWFVNDTFVGKTKPREPLFWNAKPGRFSVRVVDDQGRSDSRALNVEIVN
jgi:penicillin-binding protein 1C